MDDSQLLMHYNLDQELLVGVGCLWQSVLYWLLMIVLHRKRVAGSMLYYVIAGNMNGKPAT